MKGYTNQTNIENYTLQDIDASFSSQIESWIESVETLIEKITGRVFIADSTASERKYEIEKEGVVAIGEYTRHPIELYIDECAGTGVTALSIDDDTVDSDDYILYPPNTDPKTRIRLTEDSGLYFTKGEQNISVTAHWGYSEECPKDIELAATILASGLIQTKIPKGTGYKSVSLGPMSLTYRDEKQIGDYEQALKTLKRYLRV
jgi:hypothetical protein